MNLPDNIKSRLIFKYLIIVVCFYLFPGFSFSQESTITYRFYTNSEGLSQSTVYQILQDKQGFLWIGTGDGLNRFDGFNFKVYKRSDSRYSNLPGNSIRAIVEDDNENLWIGTDNGTCLLLKKTDTIITIPKITRNSLQGWEIPFLYKDDCLYYWICFKGIYKYNIKNDELKAISENETDKLFIEDFYLLNNKIWFQPYRSGMLCCLDITNDKLEYFPISGNREQATISICQAKNNLLIYHSLSDMYGFDINTKKTYSFDDLVKMYPSLAFFKSKSIRFIKKIYSDQFIISAVNDGIYITDNEFNVISLYSDKSLHLEHTTKSFDYITNIVNDSSGNLWIGTDGSGFCKISPYLQKFNVINNFKSNPVCLNQPFVHSLYSDGNTFYVSTFKGGLNVLDMETQKSKAFFPFHDSTWTINVLGKYDNENIIMGGNKGLCKYNTSTGKCSQFINNTSKFAALSIIQISNKTWLVGVTGGIYILKNDTLKKLNYLNKYWITILFKDKKGNIIIGMKSKIIVSRFENDSLIEIKDLTFPELISKAGFKNINQTKDGSIWVASDAGLIQFTENMGFVKLYTTNDGLSDNMLYGILTDLDDNLWISTDKGINKFNTKTFKTRTYNTTDGVQSNEFNSGAFFKANDGKLLFGGINGFNYFNPAEIKDNLSMPEVHLINIKVSDSDFVTDTIPEYKKKIVLSYLQNTISFEAIALEYAFPEKNQYAFKLVGEDNHWFYNGTKHFVRYSGLSPGTYKLWAKASNNDGIWSAPACLLTIVIKPAYWQTAWFKISIVAGILTVLVLIVILITKAKYKKQIFKIERQHEIDNIRFRISQDIHDDIGSNITKIAMTCEVLKKENEVTDKVNNKLTQLSYLSRKLMDDLREIVWSVNPRYDNLDSLSSYLRNYTGQFLEDSNIRWNFTSDSNLQNIEIKPDLRRSYTLCFKETLNNIVKHANASEVKILFNITNQILTLSISDNGKGFDINNVSQLSNGIKNIRKRMNEINAKVDIYSEAGKGTSLIFSSKTGI